MFDLLTPKPILKRLLALYSLIFLKSPQTGPNTPRNQGTKNWAKGEGISVGSCDLFGNFSKISNSTGLVAVKSKWHNQCVHTLFGKPYKPKKLMSKRWLINA